MNNVTITGNLGRDAEHRQMPDGTSVLAFSVADSQGREKPVIWWNCSLFGKRAESLGHYLVKGTPVTVVGQLSEREFTKDGEKRIGRDVRVTDIALQGVKQSTEAPARPKQAQSQSDDMDDSDIPF